MNKGSAEDTAIREAAAKRNAEALGDTNAPGTISNAGVVPSQREVTLIEVPPEVMPGESIPIRRMEVARPTVCTCEPMVFDEEQINLIKGTVGGNLTNPEFKLFLYLAGQYHLDPIRKQIWAVKYGDSPAQIFTGRDGFLEIAHRSGQFDGMKSWVEYDDKEKPLAGHCTVWRKDMTHPFESVVLFKEYTTGKNLWDKKPSVMIVKVAESVCLRKAFSVSGLYAPEEMGDR
jgi:phage recombination protein Bet